MQLENNTNLPAGTSFGRSVKNYFNYRAFEGAALFLLLFFYIVAMTILFSIRTTPLLGYETDGITFMMKSRALFTKYFSPPTLGAGVGIVFAMRFFDMIVHDTFAAGKLISMIAGFFYLLASFKVMKKLYAPSTGLLTVVLLLVNPTVVIYSTISGSDMAAAAFLMMALWALLDNQRNSRVFLAGLCLGLGFTVRCVYIIFIILIFSVMRDFKNNRLRVIYKFVIASIGFIVGSLPQLAVNTLYYGSPIFTNSWRLVALTLHEGVYDSGFFSLSFAKVNQQGWLRLGYLWMKRFIVQIPIITLYAVFWPAYLAVPGYVLSLRRFKQNSQLLILLGVSIILYLFFLSSVFFENEPRYLLPVFPLLLASSMAMLRILVNDKKIGIVIGFTVILLITVFATIEKTKEYIAGGQAMEFKKAGLFLNAKAGPHDIIIASQPHVFFYARRPGKLFESFRKEELENFAQNINARGIKWVVFDERYGAKQFPSLVWLLDPESSQAAAHGWYSVFNNKTEPHIVVWHVQ